MGADHQRMAMDASFQCDGKVPFASFTAAQVVVKRTQAKERPKRSAYHCVHCQLWHIGTDPGRISSKKKAEFKNRKFNDE